MEDIFGLCAIPRDEIVDFFLFSIFMVNFHSAAKKKSGYIVIIIIITMIILLSKGIWKPTLSITMALVFFFSLLFREYFRRKTVTRKK